MFQPALWQQTKVSIISLFTLGLLLAIPAGFVFVFAAFVFMNFGTEVAFESNTAGLFWTALVGSAAGLFAWMGITFLLFQRNSVRLHQIVWQLVRAAGPVIILCTAFWLFWPHDSPAPGARPVLIIILLTSPLLIWLGQRNLSLTNCWLSHSSPPCTKFG